MSGFNLDDYVDVAERIRLFYDRYPDGRLVTESMGKIDDENGRLVFIYCKAAAYRTPDDPTPCTGFAWEPIPGPTPYTRDSELMNAETAAWGRAIVAAGIPSTRIASRQEAQPRAAANGPKVTKAQHAKIGAVIKELNRNAEEEDWVAQARAWISQQYGKTSRADLTADEAGKLIEFLEAQVEAQGIPFG